MCSVSYVYYVYFFFFFQAEDGIRDYKVTGVQTCALPIAAAGVMSNAALVVPLRSEARAVSVKLVPAVLRLKSAKLATPFTAATVVPPASTPPLGLLPRAPPMAPGKPRTVLPDASLALTW